MNIKLQNLKNMEVAMPNEMLLGHVLRIGSQLTSSNGVFTAELQSDGNFTVRDDLGRFSFASGSDNRVKFLHMQLNGMLVMMDVGQRIVRTATEAGVIIHASKFVLRNDGKIVLVIVDGNPLIPAHTPWIDGVFT
jgi:hypothetical protein